MNLIKKVSCVGTIAVLLAGIILFFLPPKSAFAQSPLNEPTPPAVTTPPDGEGGKLRQAGMEKLFKVAQKNHANQEKLITQAEKMGSKFAEIITKAKANGKDTTSLEAALAALNVKIGEANAKYDLIGNLITQHAGFDSDGKVTESATAKTTLEAIRTGSKEVRQTLGEALKGLKGAGNAFREANPKPTPTGTPISNPA